VSDTLPSDVVRRTMLALGRGDLDAFVAGLCEDVEWQGSGVLLPIGVWHGRDGVLAGLRRNAEVRGHPARVVLREVASRGSTVLLLGVIELEDAHGRTSVPNSWVFELRGELVQRVTAYLSDSLARAGWARLS
jgi:ketosteroid isomerase-like protein